MNLIAPLKSPTRLEQMVGCILNDLVNDMQLMRSEVELRHGQNLGALWSILDSHPNPISVAAFTGQDEGAAFRLNPYEGRIEFNSIPFMGIRGEVLKKVPGKDLRHDLVRDLVRGFGAHELFHAGPQNMASVAIARAIAQGASSFQLGIMDLKADVFAGQCAAAIDCKKRNNSTDYFYFWNFQQQLVMNLDFWIPQVKAPAIKPHKRMRFLGQAMMAARIDDALQHFSDIDVGDLPLDVGLFPLTDSDGCALTILALSPEMAVWMEPRNINPSALANIVDGLESRRAAETVALARQVLYELGQCKAPR